MSAPVFLFADARSVGADDRLVLDGEEGRHAADVRRLRIGESIRLTDGVGTALTGVVTGVRRGALDIEVHEKTVAEPSAPRLVVAQALAKGGRDEAAIEAMTEIGVDEVIPWQASRSIAQWTERSKRRWHATIRTAAKQSRRMWWPTVADAMSTTALADRCGRAGVCLVLHESAPAGLPAISATGECLVVVGPEGGITDDEMAVLTGAGGLPVRLGETVLRSSTAGVAALAAIAALTRWRR